MRGLIGVVLAAAVLWGGYWFVGSRAAENGAKWALTEAERSGAVVQYTDLSVAGFPNRFDLTLTEPRLGDAASGVVWSAPFAQVFSLSYKPWHFIAALPPEQSLEVPGDRLTIASTRMQGSLVLEPGLAMVLDRSAAVIDALQITARTGHVLGADKVQWASQQTVGRDAAHDIAFEATNLAPDPAAQQVMVAAGLPGVIDRVSLQAEVRMNRPVAGRDLAGLAIDAVNVTEALVQWGAVRAVASGELAPDADGFATGTLTVRVEGWQQIPQALAAAGVIGRDGVAGLTIMLQGMAAQSGGQTIEAPLTLRGGWISFGFVPLGPAPRLR